MSKEDDVIVHDGGEFSDESSISNSSTNPFLDPAVEKKYRQIYENSQYECRERFDPEFTWTKKEERKLVWKLEYKVTFLACLMFAALQVDRGNLSQAVSDNMLADLNITTDVYNTGNTIFYLCFLAMELPSQLVSKRLGADVWIPLQMCAWSIVSLAQFWLKGKNSFYACRALLGIFEGGFIPDLVLWMSYFFTASELSIRLSLFWTTLELAQIVSAFEAYGFLHMRGISGKPGWAWLFLIEGLSTLVIGIAAWFIMVPSVVQTKKPWNKKGWFTEREEKIVVNRVLRDDPTKGDMNNRQGLTPKMLFKALCDYHEWPIYMIGLLAYIPQSTVQAYFTLLLKNLGFSTFQSNLLTIPSYVIHIILLLGLTWLTERVNERILLCLSQPLWIVPLMGILRWWGGANVNKWGTYVVVTLIMGSPYIHAIMVSMCSRNSQSIKNRTVSASLYNMFVQAGSIIASNIYRTNDKPMYYEGNTVLFWLSFAMLPLLLFTKFYYVSINRYREKRWSKMSQEEREEYITSTLDVGSKRLDFRFAH
ncbi:hypothetical protein OGAPHI_001979 [Ogataea philodendri]|uniref:Allantoate permease n=1 Tax=Ogataea philodendri TaxID=1378263 RepID=A0A9P8T7J0_9ASCO|nr:uncharacterized protein OGAPHI_001979 [Ogataea philodendri]KAH3668225.1 hypothetical protein OGAPHI_001979 [Ogataea philodendri]